MQPKFLTMEQLATPLRALRRWAADLLTQEWFPTFAAASLSCALVPVASADAEILFELDQESLLPQQRAPVTS